MMYDDGKLLKGSYIEPYAVRRKRSADKRAESVARKAAELAGTYARLRLAVPMRLTPKPLPESKPAFIPYQIKRERGATGRRDSARATAIRGSRLGRPPSSARIRALASGQKTYQGGRCPHGHSGLRYVVQGSCVACAKLRNDAAKSRRLKGASAQESLRRA
jgi:hypothetical protein